MNVEDKEELGRVKSEIIQEVNKDISLAISSFKVWLMATILSNVVLIGVPALYVFFTTQLTSQAAYDLAKDNKSRLDSRSDWIGDTDQRLDRVEQFLQAQHDYVPPPRSVRPK